MSESVSRVVLVGHCGPDTFMLKSAVKRAAPDATIEEVHSDEDAMAKSAPGVLLLVNRVLDGRFTDGDGIALIERMLLGGGTAMLISNFQDAQERAEAIGALPGFGKSQLNTSVVQERLTGAIGSVS